MIKLWHGFCKLLAEVFYRNFEVAGLNNIPENAGVIFCANHVNALVDPLLLQAASDKLMHPLARSGLFANPFLKPFLKFSGAVPIYRSQDNKGDTSQNQDTFCRVYELLEQGEWIMIFPEGQSHSDPSINPLKTGAARMAMGYAQKNGHAPKLIPVGLNFSKKGKFRGDALIYFGEPIKTKTDYNLDEYAQAQQITSNLVEGLKKVTINAKDWGDIELAAKIDKFFFMRGKRDIKHKLKRNFRVARVILNRQKLLRKHHPNRLEKLTAKLKHFERMCKRLGIKTYHLDVEYSSGMIFFYMIRLVFMLLIALPISLWGLLNSGVPFYLTRHLTELFTKDKDQYETTKMLLGLGLFPIFWAIQTYVVYQFWGLKIALFYLLSVMIASVVAMKTRGEMGRVKENLKVFFLFAKKSKVKEHLKQKRTEIEQELIRLVKSSNKLIKKMNES